MASISEIVIKVPVNQGLNKDVLAQNFQLLEIIFICRCYEIDFLFIVLQSSPCGARLF